ncbi:MAG: HD domain-containing protein [bacterium]|nr:HD domain-containing protein [bacterium]
MNENFDVFDDFVMKYDMTDSMIAYKYNHSYRVVHQAEEIARSINLEEEDRDIASLIGLLHDTARFRQWTDYKTFDDNKSFDHGDEAIKILYEEGLINKFKVNHEYDSVIKKAIIYHNKAYIDDYDMTIKEKLHSKIIRDADKIDILYSFSTNRLLELEEDDNPISPKVRETFMKHKIILKTDCVSLNDRIILLLGLVFDLNYKYSKNKVYNENYIGKMYEGLKHKDIFKEYIDEINKYFKEEE